jgi:hypothetical protein
MGEYVASLAQLIDQWVAAGLIKCFGIVAFIQPLFS